LVEKWADETTRSFLAQRAVQDDSYDVRSTAIQALAEKWADETTRSFLAQRAVQDDSYDVRSTALQALAEKWPDETTRALLAQRAVEDPNGQARHEAFSALLVMHSEFGRILLLTMRTDIGSPFFDPLEPFPGEHIEWAGGQAGILHTMRTDVGSPYLDPLEPIPREHIGRAAERAGIRPEEIDAQVASLSAHLGWDITRGAKKRRRKR